MDEAGMMSGDNLSAATAESNSSQLMVNSSNSDQSQFPVGMRVLLVEDALCLIDLFPLLQECHYNVKSATNSAEALELLQHKDYAQNHNESTFDVVLTEIHSQDIDGFKILEAGLELGIPVIMMSTSDDKGTIMKAIEHGALHVFLKPLVEQVIKNMWQHVYRKSFLAKEVGCLVDAVEEFREEKVNVKRKIRRGGEKNSTMDRIKWDEELHKSFLDAIERLGGVHKAKANKILELMGSRGITRAQVASHLQKHRNNLRKKKADVFGKSINSNNLMYQNYQPFGPPTVAPQATSFMEGMMAKPTATTGAHSLANYPGQGNSWSSTAQLPNYPGQGNNWSSTAHLPNYHGQGNSWSSTAQLPYNRPQPTQVFSTGVSQQYQPMGNMSMANNNYFDMLTRNKVDNLLSSTCQQPNQPYFAQECTNQPRVHAAGHVQANPDLSSVIDDPRESFSSSDFLDEDHGELGDLFKNVPAF